MSALTERARRLVEWAQDLPPVAVDAVLAFACFATVITYGFIDGALEWWVFVLAAANALPLLWRRRYPVLVAALCGVTTTWMAAEDVLGQIPSGTAGRHLHLRLAVQPSRATGRPGRHCDRRDAFDRHPGR